MKQNIREEIYNQIKLYRKQLNDKSDKPAWGYECTDQILEVVSRIVPKKAMHIQSVCGKYQHTGGRCDCGAEARNQVLDEITNNLKG